MNGILLISIKPSLWTNYGQGALKQLIITQTNVTSAFSGLAPLSAHLAIWTMATVSSGACSLSVLCYSISHSKDPGPEEASSVLQ